MLSYRRYGADDGHALMLLHSLGTDGRMWDECAEQLDGKYMLIVPDMRGHGDSGPSESQSVGQWADDVDAVVQDAGAHAVSVIGVSMGGIQAMAYAATFPKRVDAVVVADSFLTMTADVRDKKIAALIGDVKTVAMSTIAKDYVAATFSQPYPRGAARVEAAIADIDPDSYVAATLACFSVDIVDLARGISVPTLVLWGDRDDKIPRPYSEQIARTIRDSKFQIVSGAGHLSNVDNPNEFSRLISEFLACVAEL